MKLTQANVKKVKLPAGRSEHIEWDEELHGFGIRLRGTASKCSKTWVVQYKIGTQHRRLTLGSLAMLTADEARNGWQGPDGKKHLGASKVLSNARHGLDAATDRRAARHAVSASKAAKVLSEHVVDFLEARAVDTKPRSLAEMKRLLQKDYWRPLHSLPLPSITRQMVATRLDHIDKHHGRVPASHARIALSSFFKWAIERCRCEDNPVIGTARPKKPEPRERVLDDSELAAVWNNAPASDYGAIVKLLALTGQRREEIGGLRWSELKDLDDPTRARIELPGERTKNGKPHDVPLSGAALAVINAIPVRNNRDLVFGSGEGAYSGWSASKKALDTKSGVKDWRLHDLRRTAATRMGDSGVQPHIIEITLNHISGHRAGVAGIYQRSTYATEKRQALDTLASYVHTALAKVSGANVTRIKRVPS